MLTLETPSSGELIEMTGWPGRRALVSWDRLAWGRPPSGVFDPDALSGLPEPARRWLTHAIVPGTPLWHGVVLEITGRKRVAGWRRFDAIQILALPHGYIWAARAWLGFVPFSGYSRYLDGEAEMRWSLCSGVPIHTASNGNLVRVASARTAFDAIFVPTAFLGPHVSWCAGSTPDSAIAEWAIDNHVVRSQINVADDGSLLSVEMRCGTSGADAGGIDLSYGGVVGDELEFQGIRIATSMRFGYLVGSQPSSRRETYRATITSAAFF